jgi:hypothetical protein
MSSLMRKGTKLDGNLTNSGLLKAFFAPLAAESTCDLEFTDVFTGCARRNADDHHGWLARRGSSRRAATGTRGGEDRFCEGMYQDAHRWVESPRMSAAMSTKTSRRRDSTRVRLISRSWESCRIARKCTNCAPKGASSLHQVMRPASICARQRPAKSFPSLFACRRISMPIESNDAEDNEEREGDFYSHAHTWSFLLVPAHCGMESFGKQTLPGRAQ